MTRSGSISYTNAKFGSGAQITGNTSYLSFPRSVISTAACTVEFYFSPNFSSVGISNYKTLLDCDTGVTSNRLILGWYSGGFYFSLFNNVSVHATPTFSNGQAMHFALVWDKDGIAGSSDTVRCYVDGNLHCATNYGIWQAPTFNNVYVGHHVAGNGNADGTIDNLKVSHYAKTNFSDRFTE
ncbi:MAG: hypothetical protein J0L75_19835 [Spirochaetes bacterium]|nr:hypothetical protein [Spirochaetota bacterium]